MKKDPVHEAKSKLRLHRIERNKNVTEKLDLFVYWTSLALLAVFNILAVFFLVPVLLFFDGLYLYIAVGGFGLAFGFLFNLLILGIEHLEQRHNVIAGIFIPILSVVDILIILKLSQKLSVMLQKTVEDVPAIIIVFIVSFVVPYLISAIAGKHRM